MHTFLVSKEVYFLLLDSQSNVFCKLYLHIVGPIMNLGLRVRRMSGMICKAMSVSSRVWEGWRLFMWLVSFPRWVVMIMYIEYMAVMMMFMPVRMMEGLDQENIDITMNSSPMRLINGGRAKLAKLAISHHVAISGKIICRPRAIIMVRLWMRS